MKTEEQLESFVKAAVDEYYIKFLLQGEDEHCDLTNLPDRLPEPLRAGLVANLSGVVPITDLTPASMRTLTTEEVKRLLALFKSPAIKKQSPSRLRYVGGLHSSPA